MSPRGGTVGPWVWTPLWLPAAITLSVLITSTMTVAHSTAVQHDFHIIHNVDNRSPEIDPFWYVGRGVRPIGRFGKRHSGVESRGTQPVLNTLELLLDTLQRSKQNQQQSDWLP